MSQTDVVTVLKIETGESENTIKSIKKEISDLKKVLEGAEIGSEAFEKASKDLAAAQQQLKTVMDSTKKTVSAAEGSYDALVATMAELKKQWRATADEAKRNEIGKQIEAINTELKELDATLGNHQRNVGNYKGDIIEAFDEMGGGVKSYSERWSEMQKSTEQTRAKFESVQKMASGLASGFAAVQGAAALFGAENENLQKTLVKVQAAMAIAQGIGGLKDLIEGFTQAKTAFAGATMGLKAMQTQTVTTAAAVNGAKTATIGATTAVKGLSGALISTGIGAILAGIGVAVGAIVFNWDKISKMWSNTDPQKKAAKEARELNYELNKLANQSAAEKIVRVRELANAYANLGDNLDEKKKFVTKYSEELENMGIKMTDVNDAEKVFYEYTDEYCEAIMARARADAARQKATEDYQKALDGINEAEKEAAEKEAAYDNAKSTEDTADDAIDKVISVVTAGFPESAAMQRGAAAASTAADDAYDEWQAAKSKVQRLKDKANADMKKLFDFAAAQDELANEWLTADNQNNNKNDKASSGSWLDKIRAQAKKQADEARKIAEQKAAEAKKIAEQETAEAKKIAERARKSLIDTREEELAEQKRIFNKEKLFLESKGIDTANLVDENRKKVDEINKKWDDKEKADREKAANDIMSSLNDKLDNISYNSSIKSDTVEIDYSAKLNNLDENDAVGAIQLEIDKTLELQGIRERAFEEQMAQIKAVLDAEKEKDLLSAEQEAELQEQYNAIQQEKVLATAEATNQINALNKQMIEQQKADNRELAKNITTTFTSALNAASNILSAVQEGIDTTNKEGFEKSKNLQIANATIQAIVGITTALAGAYTTKTGPWDIPLAYAQAATIAATTGIQIANIKKQTFDGSGSSGNLNGSAGVSPNISMADMIPINYTKDVLTDTETAELNKGNRVYVVESDITETQNDVAVKESNSSF